MRPTTLCFLMNERGQILLGRKKRGFGVSKWNGFGGKLEPGETFRQCAVRELKEESGIIAAPEELHLAGFLDFKFSVHPELDHIGYVYFLYTYSGNITETEEMEPQWFPKNAMPYQHMWQGDRTWIPLLLQGKKITGTVIFADDDETVQSLDITEVETLKEIEKNIT